MVDRDLPLKKQIANNIRRIMDSRGWTQLELSKRSGISKSTLSDYLNCKTLIKAGNVQKLADVFGVLKSDIDPSFISEELLKQGISPYVPGGELIIDLPIVGKISCGEGTLAYEEIDGFEPTPKEWLNGGQYFYLRAKGDSMKNARIYEGDLLLIRRQEDVENGEIAAVLIDGDAVLKRVYKTDSTVILQSENPEYKPIILDGTKDIKIIGKLKRNVITY
ncbi:helix-turn-helix domain-containing protein [Oceanobacillus caeni]|uniref:LexA family protein n=1 Tax=Oceanobacillus caeni TaxID=405946 RepID=UPI00214A706F|nr:LexA family transcriptional regulator [Oceanobacillus caeni]MCR1835012.1 helix-turn-helix domain-containing protein [Oceanobacillus caeni]